MPRAKIQSLPPDSRPLCLLIYAIYWGSSESWLDLCRPAWYSKHWYCPTSCIVAIIGSQLQDENLAWTCAWNSFKPLDRNLPNFLHLFDGKRFYLWTWGLKSRGANKISHQAESVQLIYIQKWQRMQWL